MTSGRLPEAFRGLGDPDWFRLLAASINQPLIEGVSFPRFPPADLQERFVGQSGVDALRTAYSFYVFTKTQMRSLGHPLQRSSRFLDFGCGWGRLLRFFWKDVDEGNLFGCDTRRDVIELCESLDTRAELAVVDPLGPFPYPDSFFDGVLANSVFTHLPRQVHLHWMRELARVCKPRAVVCLTLEPRRFLDHVATIPATTTNAWERELLRCQPSIQAHAAEFAAEGFTFLPTIEGQEAVYGDAVCSAGFITRHWGEAFDLATYIDHPSQSSQSAVAVQRRP